MIAGAALAAGCNADQPVLTLVFEHVPADATNIDVVLHGQLGGRDATFMGPDAGNSDVAVSYVGGDVLIAVEAAYAAAHGHHIRLPLTAGDDIELHGTARARGGSPTKTAETSAAVGAHQSATLKFDFDAAGDGGIEMPAEAGDAGTDADTGGDAGLDANDDGNGDTGGDTKGDVAADAPVDMAPGDVPVDTPADVPAEMPAGSDASDAGGDATIGLNCTVGGQYTASFGTGGSGPTVAYAAPFFGVAWKAGNDLLYNAVTANGTMLDATADKTVVSGTGQGLTTPRLARVGTDFVLAYGRHDTTGGHAAAVRITPSTGTVAGTLSMGMNRPGATAAPEIGEVAVSGDDKKVVVISRPADLAAQTSAIVDEFNDALTFVTARMPSALGATRTTGIGWAPGRFIAAAVTDATSGGGSLLELSDDTNLTIGPAYPFTSGTAAPVIGSATATISVAGAGDRVAAAWIDLQAGRRVVSIAMAPFSTRASGAPVAASANTAVSRHVPHLVFDGAVFVLVWLEANGPSDAQIKLRRFDPTLAPVGATLDVGAAGAVGLGDFDVTAAGPNVYGVTAALNNGPQRLFYITCSN